jgi:Asp-tRNA(Asn)/Glu-tRNA(Gln) amidotransferase A subunit family amidase
VSIVFVIRTSKDNTLSAAKEPTAGFKFTSISNLAEAYRSGSITPLAVAEAVLHGIQNSDEGPKPLRSIVQCNKQAVIAMAQKSTSRLANNTPLSLLDGIPVAVKEELAVVCFLTGLSFRQAGRQTDRQTDTQTVEMHLQWIVQ